jgi:hypothetical protein
MIWGLSVTFIRRGLFVLLAAIITLISQEWIGGSTIYGAALETKRQAMHEYILQNRLPNGVTWQSLGANSTNIRVGAVFAAEALHRVTHVSVLNAYIVIDTLALFCTLLVLFWYLKRWFDDTYCLLGALSFAIVLPLTYILFAFHPWDRPSVLLWLVSICLVRDRRLFSLALVMALNVAVKFDAVVFPGLFFLAYVTRRNWVATTLTTGLLFVVTFGVFAVLLWARPGGFDPNARLHLIQRNFDALKALQLAYPPWLGFTIPLIAAAIGFSSADRFIRASAAFGALLFIPLFFGTNFGEFRAEVPVFLLLLPAALHGASLLMAPANSSSSRVESPRFGVQPPSRRDEPLTGSLERTRT